MGIDSVSSCIIEDEFAYACTGIGVAIEANGLAVSSLNKITNFQQCS